MTLQKSLTRLTLALPKLQSALIAVAAIYAIYTLKQAYQIGDKVADKVTEPAGQAWSDVSAWAGGWSPVELTDLIIQPWYMDNNYKLTDEAYKTLSKAYPKEVAQYFDNRVLKTQYRRLVGQPVRGF
ncbi:hypothetical protein [Shewanella sp. TB7-MNA-CIBAN-0143]|uniref:hypothetical protein n=1 Tax=Shewanella sp. TB7-MNA-CIBAN-0143 TaxID=3140465 RepID=UPI0033261DE4